VHPPNTAFSNNLNYNNHPIQLHPKSLSKSNYFIQRTMSSSSSSATTTNAMEFDPQRITDITENLQYVRTAIQNTVQQLDTTTTPIQLVAVSKTKPLSDILIAYKFGNQRYFGENYVQELISKAAYTTSEEHDNNDEIQSILNNINWHFIGPLQSNKANLLVSSLKRKLKCVESVSTLKLALKLDKAVGTFLEEEKNENKEEKEMDYKLTIYIQVNTSSEDSKSGVESIDEALTLIKDINTQCPHLKIGGLMTIGAPDDYSCFDTLVSYRDKVKECWKDLTMDSSSSSSSEDCGELVLSMGMSGDFEEAIKRGSTSVRVGSTIFGARDYSKKK
jgi:hypothetical protein